MQVLDYFSGTFDWPRQLQQLSTLGLLIGLPIVLVLAWYHGDRGQQRISTPELAILTLLLLLGGGALWYYQRASEGARAAAPAATTAKPDTSPAAKDARPSVAVLPFENRSREADDAYFVDGIHDDILTQLSKVSALRVISRASVEQFRDTKLPMKAIADQLGVTKVLEGGVQRAGERVRINVQLIDAGTDAHLWADSYDRELTAGNIFAIQSEVAEAISDALKATLTPAELKSVNTVPTHNLQAWEAYQLGRHSMARRTTEGLAKAVELLERAIALDPDFALAYVTLANTLLVQVDYGANSERATNRASELISQALELNPGLAEAVTSSAMLAWTKVDYEKAEAEFRRAIDLSPNSAEANHWLSNVLADLGRTSESLKYAQRSAQLDPLSAAVRVNLGAILEEAGQFSAAAAEFGRAIEINASNPNAHFFIGLLKAYAQGRVDEGVPWLRRAAELDPARADAPAWLSGMYFDLGDDAAAEHWLDQIPQVDAEQPSLKIASCIVALYRGQSESAVKYAREAVAITPPAGITPLVPIMLAVLRDADLEHDASAAARERYARAYPELFDASPRVDGRNYRAAIDLALVLRRTDDELRAAKLLDLSEALIRQGTRLGARGFGLADAQLLAVRGAKREALAALQRAQMAGWRGPLWRYHRDHDGNLTSIRSEPEFKAVFADIERDMAQQRARLAARPKDAPLDFTATGT
jgi:TolB-like protein/Flp pilus assembly protein TadD